MAYIYLHIDDQQGEVVEGAYPGFRVIRIRADDLDWIRRVIDSHLLRAEKAYLD